MATRGREGVQLIYAELDLFENLLRFACAGHTPPLVALPGDEPWSGNEAPPKSATGPAIEPPLTAQRL